jgi:hypothetical protein
VALIPFSREFPEPLTLQEQAGHVAYMPSPATFSYQMETVLYHDLSLLCPVTLDIPTSDPDLLDVACGVHDMVIEARSIWTEHSDVYADTHHPHTVREWLGEDTTDRLLLLCLAENEEALPKLYHSWGGGGRCRGVSGGWFTHNPVEACVAQDVPALEVTPTQVMAFQNFHFSAAACFEVGTGFTPSVPLLGMQPQQSPLPCWKPTAAELIHSTWLAT